MRTFLAVTVALSSPTFRAWLQGVFAELSVVFLNWLGTISIVMVAVFAAAIVLALTPLERITMKKTTGGKECETSSSPTNTPTRSPTARWTRSLLMASLLMPLTVTASPMHESRRLVNTTVPWTLANNLTAYNELLKMTTKCKYSGKNECIENPQNVPQLGEYKRGPGRCVAFDSAYVNTTLAVAAIPNRYLPIAVEDAYAQGFSNKFSEWSDTNQAQFKVDCPILYNDTVAKGQEYLCCTESQYGGLQTQVRMIPGQCTACKENLRSVWCQMTCSPDNSEFVEPVSVRLMPGDSSHAKDIYPALEELNYFVGKDWIRDIYDFCEKDSSFALLCSPLQNCTDGYGLMNFMGQYKFNSLGSPLQINVKTMDQYSDEVQKEKFCSCDSNSTDCFTPANARLESCFGVCGSVCSITADDKRSYTDACYGAKAASAATEKNVTGMDPKWDEFMAYMAEGLVRADFTALNIFLGVFGGVAGIALIVGFVFVMRMRRKYGTPVSAHPYNPAAGGAFDERRLSVMDDWISDLMKRWGLFLGHGKRPFIVSGIVLIIVIVCSIGISNVEVETTPVKLWVSTSSRPYKERAHYGEIFTPFYRSEQVVMIPKDGGKIARAEYLRDAIRIQENVANTFHGSANASYPERVRLQDVCWKATGTSCTINSITQYFQNRLDHFDFYQKYDLAETHYSTCLYSPSNQDVQTCNALRSKLKDGDSIPSSMSDCPCLSAFGSPMNLYNTYLGGFPSGADKDTTLYMQSTALVVTALVYNYYEDAKNEPAIDWEHAFITYMKQEAPENTLFDLYFYAEISVQDEIERESNGDMLPAILSYSLMIVYVSIGINRWKLDRSFFQTSKISVGFLGIVCIMLAVATTIGFFTWCGVKLQLVIMEVVPFLTLAIGVDNIFLLVHAVEDKHAMLRREKPELFQGLAGNKEAIERTTAVLVSEGVAYIGPSIFMASCAESIAFAFGCISPMPAVLWFAAFAAVAVAVNFVLQMTLLLTIITLDKRRELSGKYDILCCVASSKPEAADEESLVVPDVKTPEEAGASAPVQTAVRAHFFDHIIDAYANFLAIPFVKLVVLLAFLALTLASIASIENIEHGLPQAESMPSDSYLISYFDKVDEYLATGPPTYYIVEGGHGRNPENFNLNDQSVEAKFCQSKDFCEEFSLPKIMEALANDMDGDITHVATGVTYSWMDDFWSFVNPDSECCRVNSQTHAYMPIDSDNATYSSLRKQNPTCMDVSTSAPPVPENMYMSLFSMFSTAPAGSLCSYGGASIYRGQFSIDDTPVPVLNESSPQVVLNSTGFGKNISAFSYMLQSRANPTQQSYIDLYSQSRRAATWISEKTGVDVWVYSFFYVFFDQYLTVVEDTYKLVGLALASIFLIIAAYFGSFLYPLLIALAAVNIVIQVMGLMKPFGIMLNGLSMVNLIIAAGISVEFCGHFVRMFAKANGTGDQRAKTALRKVLTSVLFGITITKVVGLSMLTLADSRVFQKYYFRMYMTVVVYGVLNGMLLLPVVLSVCVDVRDFFLHRKNVKGQAGSAAVDVTESPMYRGAETTKRSPVSNGTENSRSD